ncbi:pentatricopeptide repeat-containing protein At4g20770-like [Salvia splendens]|uniref:pentatricopeptide repeat-containing protein At4g20770-like n=1 Tax=Salvia splendens TaxID=180675 RepID=UPI001C268690|nr:pentatricopeptide repeat-containing protein At4g20770-like [Salvia splendens]
MNKVRTRFGRLRGRASCVLRPRLPEAGVGFVVRRGLRTDHAVETALVDMYTKYGSLLRAQALFEGAGARDRILWNAMIAGYGIHGRGEEALSVFRRTIGAPDEEAKVKMLRNHRERLAIAFRILKTRRGIRLLSVDHEEAESVWGLA